MVVSILSRVSAGPRHAPSCTMRNAVGGCVDRPLFCASNTDAAAHVRAVLGRSIHWPLPRQQKLEREREGTFGQDPSTGSLRLGPRGVASGHARVHGRGVLRLPCPWRRRRTARAPQQHAALVRHQAFLGFGGVAPLCTAWCHRRSVAPRRAMHPNARVRSAACGTTRGLLCPVWPVTSSCGMSAAGSDGTQQGGKCTHVVHGVMCASCSPAPHATGLERARNATGAMAATC